MISDEELRARLQAADPAVGQRAPDLRDQLVLDVQPAKRHWARPLILAAAAVTLVGLFGATVVPNLFPSAEAPDSIAVQTEDRAVEGAPSTESATAEDQPVYPGGPSIIRTASLMIGTEDPTAAADAYVARISALGGQVTSRTDVTDGSSAPPTSTEGAMMPRPYATGPGVWLTVEVPANRFEEALADARETGQTVRLEQTAQDVSATVADVDARVRALRSSVNQLRSLMDEATSVSEIIALEDAIAARQSELDGLVAQQRELRSSTSMSRISLALMSPDEAAAAVGEEPSDEWTAARWALGLTLLAGVLVLVVLATRRRRDEPTA